MTNSITLYKTNSSRTGTNKMHIIPLFRFVWVLT